jgi:hypothetical protein
MLPILAGILVYFAMVRLGRAVGAFIVARRPRFVWRRADGSHTRMTTAWIVFGWTWLTWACSLSLSLAWNALLPQFPLGPLDALVCLGCGALIQVTWSLVRRNRTSRAKLLAAASAPAPLERDFAVAIDRTEAADIFGSARHFADTVRNPGFLEAWLAFDEYTIVLEHLIRAKQLQRITIPEAARKSAEGARIRINMLRLAALEAGVMGDAEIRAATERRRAGAAIAFAPIIESGQRF